MHWYGDYERRHRGLVMLMRPRDVFHWDRWLKEVRTGSLGVVPAELVVGTVLLQARGLDVVWERLEEPSEHPLMYLYSVLKWQGKFTSNPLIDSAYEEVKWNTI